MTAYGVTNAAKHRIFDWVARESRRVSSLLVFDYGCGSGSDWPDVLGDHPNISLIGFEPNADAAAKARARMGELPATVVSGDGLRGEQFQADVVVSLSVFEHVVDRPGYLETARRHLAPGGTFFLNYDDGHFRHDLPLESPRKWHEPLRALGRHRLSPWLAKLGRTRSYAAPVPFARLRPMVEAAGFVVHDDRLENLTDFKIMVKSVPEERREAFVRHWVDTEDTLNRELGDLTDGSGLPYLWHRMLSRTLTLRHEPAAG